MNMIVDEVLLHLEQTLNNRHWRQQKMTEFPTLTRNSLIFVIQNHMLTKDNKH